MNALCAHFAVPCSIALHADLVYLKVDHTIMIAILL
jgi:hypothetical protein